MLQELFDCSLDWPIIRSAGSAVTGATLSAFSSHFRQSFTAHPGGCILSLDPDPGTLLALLAATEGTRHPLVLGRSSAGISHVPARFLVTPTAHVQHQSVATDFCLDPGILLHTSGTTGSPKLVHQTLEAMLGRIIGPSLQKNSYSRWLLSYEPHSFAGLQVILSAAISGGTVIAPESREPASLAEAACQFHVTHLGGTPTMLRAFLIALGGRQLSHLRQISMGGEAADQAILDRLADRFPETRISHIYASSEAGALFSVHDGRAGFPRSWLDTERPDGVRLRLNGDILEVQSPRAMIRYALGQTAPFTHDGWLLTGDRIRLTADRALFAGRADNVVNVAGLKVSPEEVEEYLLSLPEIAEARVRPVPSPLTGYLLSANVVFHNSSDQQTSLRQIRAACHRDLPPHKIPRQFHAVPQIATTLAGKKL